MKKASISYIRMHFNTKSWKRTKGEENGNFFFFLQNEGANNVLF